jgi:hypothetical protein
MNHSGVSLKHLRLDGGKHLGCSTIRLHFVLLWSTVLLAVGRKFASHMSVPLARKTASEKLFHCNYCCMSANFIMGLSTLHDRIVVLGRALVGICSALDLDVWNESKTHALLTALQ